MSNSTGLVSDDIVLKARRLIRENPELHHRAVAEQFRVPMMSLEKAVRGATYRHLNEIEPPVIRQNKKEDKRLQAIELYKKGLSYNAIKDEIGVSKASLSLWLRDIPRPDKQIVESPKIQAVDLVRETPVESNQIRKTPRKPEVGIPAEHPFTGYKLYKYTEADGVCRVQLSRPGDKQILSYGRYLMAVHLGRVIESHEIVIHKDGKEDVIDNLLVMAREELRVYNAEKRKICCIICDEKFVPRRTVVKTCSRKCTREYQTRQMKAARLTVLHTCTECGSEFKSASNKPLTCSPECLNKRKTRLRNEKKPPKIPKPPKPPKIKVPKEVKPKSNVPSRSKLYHNECAVCEKMFYTSLKNKDVCYDQDCKDVIASYGDGE